MARRALHFICGIRCTRFKARQLPATDHTRYVFVRPCGRGADPQGCRRFGGRPTIHGYEYLGLAASVGAVFYWTMFAPNENARAAAMSGVLGYTRMAVG